MELEITYLKHNFSKPLDNLDKNHLGQSRINRKILNWSSLVWCTYYKCLDQSSSKPQPPAPQNCSGGEGFPFCATASSFHNRSLQKFMLGSRFSREIGVQSRLWKQLPEQVSANIGCKNWRLPCGTESFDYCCAWAGNSEMPDPTCTLVFGGP